MWKRFHDLIILLRSKVLVRKDSLTTPIVIVISVLSHETRTVWRIYINNTIRVVLAYGPSNLGLRSELTQSELSADRIVWHTTNIYESI